MQVAKWGNSLAVRLPAKLVEQLGLKPGDNVELLPGEGQLSVYKQVTRDDALRRLFEACDQNPMVPDDYKFDREEANER
jgi:antitoxin MazE